MRDDLSRRDRSILQAIISTYIGTGEPVGSRFLSRRHDLNLSSATIRNIMADLEEMGYLKQPHISAGRVPTDKAYRFLVDGIVNSPEGDPTLINLERLYRYLRGKPDHLMQETSRTLSHVSHYIGLVLAPRIINTVLKHIEFLKLRGRNILAILVTEEGIIHNKLLITDKEYSQRELATMGNLLTSAYADRPLREVRTTIREEIARDKTIYDGMFKKALSLGSSSLEDEAVAPEDVYVEGASNIFALPEFADLEKMKSLLQAVEEKSRLIDILDRCIDAEGVKIFIGAENPYRELQDLSLITAPYKQEGKVLGVIGVLGPTRMEYTRVIPMVDYTAKYLTRLLSERY